MLRSLRRGRSSGDEGMLHSTHAIRKRCGNASFALICKSGQGRSRWRTLLTTQFMARKTDHDRVIELENQIQALVAKKRSLDARRISDERRRIARQNIIVGGWIRANQPNVFQEVVAALRRPQDVESFK